MTPNQKHQLQEMVDILKDKLFNNVITVKPKCEYYDSKLGISIKNYNEEEIRVKLL